MGSESPYKTEAKDSIMLDVIMSVHTSISCSDRQTNKPTIPLRSSICAQYVKKCDKSNVIKKDDKKTRKNLYSTVSYQLCVRVCVCCTQPYVLEKSTGSNKHELFEKEIFVWILKKK